MKRLIELAPNDWLDAAAVLQVRAADELIELGNGASITHTVRLWAESAEICDMPVHGFLSALRAHAREEAGRMAAWLRDSSHGVVFRFRDFEPSEK